MLNTMNNESIIIIHIIRNKIKYNQAVHIIERFHHQLTTRLKSSSRSITSFNIFDNTPFDISEADVNHLFIYVISSNEHQMNIE